MTTESLIVELDARTKKLEDKLNAVNSKMKDTENSTKSMGDEFVKTENKSNELSKALNDTNSKIAGLTDKSKALEKEMRSVNKELRDTKLKAAELGDKSTDTKDKIAALSLKSKTLGNSLKDVQDELKETKDDADKLSKELKDSDRNMGKFADTAKSVAGGVVKIGAAVTAATAAFVAFAKVQATAIRETEVLADMAGLTVEEFNRLSFVYGTVGISAEKFGDIMKDVQERIGDFTAASTGPFNDFAEVMGYTKDEALKLAKEFQNMSGQDVLQEMVNRMQDAGKTSQEMSFAFEGLSSESTRLISILLDNGKALDGLQNKFDEINVELSEEERKQFKDFANDVDAAQVAFVNFVNKGIAPFLPAIGKAAEGIADFFANFSARFDLEDILDSESPEEIVNGLKDVNQLYTLLDASRDRMNQVDSWKWFGVDPDTIAEEEQKLKDIEVKIENRLTALENLGSDAGGNGTDAPTETGGTPKKPDAPTSSGIDATKLKEELQAYRESKQGQIEALVNQRDKDLAIAQEMTATAEERQATIDTINERYLDGVQTVIDKEKEILQKAEDDKNARVARVIGGIDSELQAMSDAKLNEMELLNQAEQEKLALLANSEASEEEKNAKKLEIEQAYIEARRQLIDSELQALSNAKLNEMELLNQAEQEKLALLASSEASEEEKNAKKLEIEQAYLQERKSLLESQDQEKFDNESVQQRYDTDLAAFKDLLTAKQISEQEYSDFVKSLKAVSGIDQDLADFEERKKNKMDLLLEEEQEKLQILDDSILNEEEKNAKKLEIEQAYLEARRDLINDIAPETFDNEIVQERYEAELEALQQQLDNKLLKEEDYYSKVNDLKKKSAEDDKKTSEKVIKWEGTATKKQIDQGIQLLDAVGGNSKKLFKVKQGLSAANAVMNTSEGVTDALAQQNYPSAAIIAATGAAQLAAILSATPNGGGSVSAPSSTAPPAASASTAVEDTGSSIVAIDDITEQGTQRMVLEFNDDIIDVIAKKVDQSKQDGRI